LIALALAILGTGGYYVIKKKGGPDGHPTNPPGGGTPPSSQSHAVKDCTKLESAYKEAVANYNSAVRTSERAPQEEYKTAADTKAGAWSQMNRTRERLSECLGVDPSTIDMPEWVTSTIPLPFEEMK
jgi:hypothetical protein